MEQERAIEAPRGAPEVLSRERVREKLLDVALFQGLGGSDFDEILRISESVLVEAGEYVFEEGERGDNFFIIVRGEIELRKASAGATKKLAVLRAGQAFGEMALLNQTPRSASALAVEDTYMLSVSRAAFGEILGGDTLAVRLLRNLSKALWATSVRLAAKQAHRAHADTPHEALAEFNRLLRARLLPRVTPRVTGYDLTAATHAPRQGIGSSAWDWFLLTDGRPVFVVMKATRGDIFSAQRLAALRTLLRSSSEEPLYSLGSLLTHASRGLRSGWVDGLSGTVSCGLVALADGSAECLVAGDVAGVAVRSMGSTQDLSLAEPPVGEKADHTYRSIRIGLDSRDRMIFLSDRPRNPVKLVTSVLTGGYTTSSRGVLTSLFDRFATMSAGGTPASDLTGAVITCVKTP